MTAPILVPVVLEGDGDFEAFTSVEAACQQMEAIDVQDGVYRAFDARGARLTLATRGHDVILSRDRDNPADPDALAERLRAYLARVSAWIGEDRFSARFGDIDLQHDPLERLIAVIVKR